MTSMCRLAYEQTGKTKSQPRAWQATSDVPNITVKKKQILHMRKNLQSAQTRMRTCKGNEYMT